MTTITLPKCAEGFCGWRGCTLPATSKWITVRLPSTLQDRARYARVAYCGPHGRLAGLGVASTGQQHEIARRAASARWAPRAEEAA
jgi:hypothetical protein